MGGFRCISNMYFYQAPYQPCTVVSRQILLTNLDKYPECVLEQKQREWEFADQH